MFFKQIRKDKLKARAASDLDIQWTECTSLKCFRYRYADHLISKCHKPPKDNKKQQNQVRYNERGNRESQK